MDKNEQNPILYQTAPPGPVPYDTDVDDTAKRMVLRSRAAGIVTLVVNIALIAWAAYVFLQFDVPQTSLGITVGFVVLGIIYSLLSIGLVMILNQSSNRAALQQEVLQSMIHNYRRRTDELQLAAQVARDASAGTNLESILQEAADLVHEQFNFYHAGVFLVEDVQDETYAVLRSTAGSTLGSRKLVEERYKIKVGSRGIIGYVTERGRARVVLDVQQDSQHRLHPYLPDTRSQMAVPLQVSGQVIGAFEVQSRQVGAFSQQDVMILQTLADLLAVAIHKANLHKEVQQHAIQLERRVAERTSELATERAQLNAILDAMIEGVIYYHGNQIKYINPAFKNLMGYTRDDWEGITHLMRVSQMTEADVAKMREVMDEDLQSKGFWRGEIPMRRKDGTEFDAYVSATTLELDDEGEGIVIIVRDISQEKALQEQKSRFVAYASHELRTPLTNIKTRLYLMKRQPELFDKHFEIMQEVTGRMQRLVDDLLAKSRFDRGMMELNMRETTLNDLVGGVVEIQQYEAEKKKQSIQLHMPEAILRSSIDTDRITQVITNLVSNAINYTDEGGKITVTLRDNKEGMAEIAVSDTGVGIPPELIDHIFNPFVRADNTTAKGTGLGLNITKQIVDLHGGDIKVMSELNKGSTFIVCLKLSQPASVAGVAR